jgi:hypothetical protein
MLVTIAGGDHRWHKSRRCAIAVRIIFMQCNRNSQVLQQMLKLLHSWSAALCVPAEHTGVNSLVLFPGNCWNRAPDFASWFFQSVGIFLIHFFYLFYLHCHTFLYFYFNFTTNKNHEVLNQGNMEPQTTANYVVLKTTCSVSKLEYLAWADAVAYTAEKLCVAFLILSGRKIIGRRMTFTYLQH